MSLSDQNRALIDALLALTDHDWDMLRAHRPKLLERLRRALRAEGRPSPEPQAVARTGVVHDLKTWPEPFAAVRAGLKPWELRLDDRDFRVGDVLRLREWIPALDAYTGEVEERVVIWKLDGGQFGLPVGYAILSLAALSTPSPEAEEGATAGEVKDEFASMLWGWFEKRNYPFSGEERSDGLTADDFAAMLDDHEAALSQPSPEVGREEGLLPMATAPRDGTYIIARVARGGPSERQQHLVGRYFVIRHEGNTSSGFDLGWALHPGYGGCDDGWFDGWAHLPAALPPPAPEPGYEAVPVAWRVRPKGFASWTLFNSEPLFGADWDREEYEVQPLYASPVSVSLEDLAKTVHRARFPADREPTPFAEEDRGGQEYCRRIAAAILQRLSNQQGGG